jgi:predicted Fe-Mo cluster-binding NifX family protein
MRNTVCRFCPKISALSAKRALSAAATSSTIGSGQIRTAIPVFMGRVSPVLDTCTLIMLVDLHRSHEVGRTQVAVAGATLSERVGVFKMMGVRTIICSAVSDSFHRMLQEAKIDLVCGIAGMVDEIIQASGSGSHQQTQFRMPGFKGID